MVLKTDFCVSKGWSLALLTTLASYAVAVACHSYFWPVLQLDGGLGSIFVKWVPQYHCITNSVCDRMGTYRLKNVQISCELYI